MAKQETGPSSKEEDIIPAQAGNEQVEQAQDPEELVIRREVAKLRDEADGCQARIELYGQEAKDSKDNGEKKDIRLDIEKEQRRFDHLHELMQLAHGSEDWRGDMAEKLNDSFGKIEGLFGKMAEDGKDRHLEVAVARKEYAELVDQAKRYERLER